MSIDESKFFKEVGKFKHLLNQVNWHEKKYTLEKAYISAIFSKIAYFDLPEFELKQHSEVSIIPCSAYQELAFSNSPWDVQYFLGEFRFESFMIRTEFIVAVGIITPDVVIIALRGTRLLYLTDWLTDLSVSQVVVKNQGSKIKFHSGFFYATLECYNKIVNELQNRLKNNSDPVPVYTVGHSLGGAIAAIIFAIQGNSFRLSDGHVPYNFKTLNALSSYVFGMPRYCNNNGIKKLKTPFNTYTSGDVVPGMPPKFLGFKNVPEEYLLTNSGSIELKNYQSYTLEWLLPFQKIVFSALDHRIENYVERLRQIVEQRGKLNL